MTGGSVLLVVIGVTLLITALFKAGSSADGWKLFKLRVTRFLLVVGGLLLILLAFNGRPGNK